MSRRAGAVLAAAVAALLLGAAPAPAAIGDSRIEAAPATVTAHGTVTVRGTVDWGDPGADAPFGSAELRTPGPGPVARADRSSPDVVTWSFTTAPCAPEALCDGATVLPNGPRALELWDVERVAADDRQVAAATVLVDVPAGRPQDVTATLQGRTVTVRWARAGVAPVVVDGTPQDVAVTEPDVRWTVSDGAGRSVPATPEECVEGTCSASITYPGGESGQRAFTVTADRPCDGCTAPPTASRPSAPVEVPVVPGAAPTGPAPAGAAPFPSGSPGSAGGSGTAALGPLPSGFGGLSAPLGVPTVPALPDRTAPDVAAPPLPDTFGQTLDYGEGQQEPAVAPQAAAPSGTRLTSTGDGTVVDDQLVRGIAGALVLVLSGVHLRTWLARARREAEL